MVYMHAESLLLRNHDLAVINRLDYVMRGFAIDSTADRLSGTEDLLDATSKILRKGFVGHLAGNLKIERGDPGEGSGVEIRVSD